MKETDLYLPVKALLEAQGYQVKGEIGALDVMAVRGEEPPVIVELKLSFTLGLVHQGVARQGLSDHVYLAVPPAKHAANKRNAALCRRLGLGLIHVRLKDGHINVVCVLDILYDLGLLQLPTLQHPRSFGVRLSEQNRLRGAALDLVEIPRPDDGRSGGVGVGRLVAEDQGAHGGVLEEAETVGACIGAV